MARATHDTPALPRTQIGAHKRTDYYVGRTSTGTLAPVLLAIHCGGFDFQDYLSRDEALQLADALTAQAKASA